MRVGLGLLVGLTIACTTPYQPSPLPPLPPPVVIPPTPQPPTPTQPNPFRLLLYATPTPVEPHDQTNLVLSIDGNAPTAPFTITWSFGDGTGTTTTDKRTVPHTYTKAGKVTASAALVDAAGRRGSTEAIITIEEPSPPPVIPPPPPPEPSYLVILTATPATVPRGAPTTITATVVPQHGATPPAEYFWDCLNDGTFDLQTLVPTTTCLYATAGIKTVRGVASSATASGAGFVSVLVTP